MNKIGKEESALLSALLLLNEDKHTNLIQSHLVDSVAVKNDFILNQDATAFIFQMPSTHWKMVAVKPNADMTAIANQLSKQLVLFMLLGFTGILALTVLIFRNYFTRPLNQMTKSVKQMGDLIEQKKYRELSKHKIPSFNVHEIKVISEQTNQLIDRVVDNEGALADINTHLEKRVNQRTTELQAAIDQLKASQVQLVRSEKMASLGQMVAGVAHEVNTPLGYVRSNIEMVKDNLYRFNEIIEQTQHLIDTLKNTTASQDDIDAAIASTLACCNEIKEDEVIDDMNEIAKDGLYGVDQISELVHSLRDFSRIDESKVKAVDINDCINSSLLMAKHNLKDLTLQKDLGELEPVQCNPSQINQVLLNLFNNAADAVADNEHGELKVRSYQQDNVVIIEVSDNGSGISQDNMDKIFEPFFTTKKVGEGTGLGLTISSQIIEQHGGSLSVDSVVNQGTTFTITLPLKQANTEVKPKSTSLFID